MLISKRSLFSFRRPYKVVLIGLLTAVFGAWGAFEWKVRRMEQAVWQQGDYSELKGTKEQLEWVAEKWFTPPHLRGRVHGLLGDLYTQRKGYEKAVQHYILSMAPFDLDQEEDLGEDKLLASLDESVQTNTSQFSEGFTDYRSSPLTPAPLNDGDLTLTINQLPDEENARFDLAKITPLTEDEAQRTKDLSYRTDTEEIRLHCESLRVKIDSLCQLGDRFAPSNPDEYEKITPLADFIRLLALDAAYRMHIGQTEKGRRSFDTAFRLIGYYDQNPCLVSGILSNALRGEMIALLEAEYSRPARALFKKHHRAPEDLFDMTLLGEYNSNKRFFTSSFVEESPEGARLIQLILEENRDYYRLIRCDASLAHERTVLERTIAEYFFHNRRLIYKVESGTYEEGQQLASTSEKAQADILRLMMQPKWDLIAGAFADTIEWEAELLDHLAGKPVGPDGYLILNLK